MKFDFELFKPFCFQAYNNVGGSSYTLDEIISIFAYYFWKYETLWQEVHPNIRIEQIEKIIIKMPGFVGSFNRYIEVEPDDYFALIDSYFETAFNPNSGGCDRNINHFFSGNIRANRHFELFHI